MDSGHRPPDDVNRHEAGAGSADDDAETATGSGVESEPDATLDLGEDARSRLAGDRPDEHGGGAIEESTPAADAEAFLRRAFPESDDETSSRPEPDDAPLHRSDVAEAMQSVDAVDTLLTLGRESARDGDWSGVQGVLDAIGVFDPTREDQVRAVGVYHAVQLGQPNVARDLADGMQPGRAQDGWRRYAEGDVVLPQLRVDRYDGLWGIAEQCLGDGRRWRELRDINVGRPQPDGSRLAPEGNDIREGWTLVLPPDAERNQ